MGKKWHTQAMEIGRKPLDMITCKKHTCLGVNYYLTVKRSKEDTEIMGTSENPKNRKHKWTDSLDMGTTAICASRVYQTKAPLAVPSDHDVWGICYF
jgi:hypothetical protein